MKLSVIIITKNAAATVRRCVKSVDWADEVNVVDSGSSDNTQDICRELGARVTVTTDWPGFGPQKNRALDASAGQWIRSEERRVGKECRLTCRSRWSPYH